MMSQKEKRKNDALCAQMNFSQTEEKSQLSLLCNSFCTYHCYIASFVHIYTAQFLNVSR